MLKPNGETRVILIGGTSHVGKSTLARALATTLNWEYRPTDKMARHPGFPWVGADGQARPEFVLEHYRTLAVEELLKDVLAHYQKNVIPQVEEIISSPGEGVVIEGSALWPEFVVDFIRANKARAIFLTASDHLFQDRIYKNSNFAQADKDEQYLIQKFLDRTLLYNQRMREKVEKLGLPCLNVESMPTPDELLKLSTQMLHLSSSQQLTEPEA